MDGVVSMVGVVRVITGQGGQFGQVVGMLGSSSQHNVLSENKWVTCAYHQVQKKI